MAKRKLTKAERIERDARHERMRFNSERLRDLAERAQAQIEGRQPRTVFPPHQELMEQNIQRTRRLAERGLARLEGRRANGTATG